jgi:two-component system chemotaxis response regulator CheY
MRALIVEDDFLSRLVLQKILSRFANCDLAMNGKEAVQAFSISITENNPYDLICLDIMMPEMDGIEALKIIRQLEKDRNVNPKDEIKIIMTTALDTPKEIIESYYKGGCTSYLVKPIEINKLLETVSDLGLR